MKLLGTPMFGARIKVSGQAEALKKLREIQEQYDKGMADGTKGAALVSAVGGAASSASISTTPTTLGTTATQVGGSASMVGGSGLMTGPQSAVGAQVIAALNAIGLPAVAQWAAAHPLVAGGALSLLGYSVVNNSGNVQVSTRRPS